MKVILQRELECATVTMECNFFKSQVKTILMELSSILMKISRVVRKFIFMSMAVNFQTDHGHSHQAQVYCQLPLIPRKIMDSVLSSIGDQLQMFLLVKIAQTAGTQSANTTTFQLILEFFQQQLKQWYLQQLLQEMMELLPGF